MDMSIQEKPIQPSTECEGDFMDRPVAFRTSVKLWDHHVTIYAARDRNHAKACIWRELNDLNYGIPYTDIRALRAGEFDYLAKAHTGKRGPVCLGWRTDRTGWGCLETNTD